MLLFLAAASCLFFNSSTTYFLDKSFPDAFFLVAISLDLDGDTGDNKLDLLPSLFRSLDSDGDTGRPRVGEGDSSDRGEPLDSTISLGADCKGRGSLGTGMWDDVTGMWDDVVMARGRVGRVGLGTIEDRLRFGVEDEADRAEREGCGEGHTSSEERNSIASFVTDCDDVGIENGESLNASSSSSSSAHVGSSSSCTAAMVNSSARE